MFEEHTLFIVKFTSFHTWFVYGVIVCAMISYAMEKISLELTSLLVLAVLMIFFHFFPLLDHSGKILLDPERIIIGFANPALITIVSLLIIGQAIIQSNALNIIPSFILKVTKNNAAIAIILSLVVVIIISAFMNNTPVVVIFIPILAKIAQDLNLAPSKVMIPLSYAAILGGMMTLIGSSTNLLVSGTVANLGLEPIGFFEFVIPGSIMAIVGMLYIIFILPKIMPDYSASNIQYDDRSFVSQINITGAYGLSGKKIVEGTLVDFPEVMIRVVERKGKTYLPPFQDDMVIEKDDLIAISGTKETLGKLVRKRPKIFIRNFHMGETVKDKDEGINIQEMNLAELVVAPASRLIGQTIKKVEFYSNYNCSVIALQRKGHSIKSKISQLRLVAGDVLLILSEGETLSEIRNSKDFILTSWSMQQVSSVAIVVKTLIIFSLVIILSALNIVPITIASFSAAASLIYLNCINVRQAVRAIDRRVSLMIVASIAMGYALQVTGGASLLAEGLVNMTVGLSQVGIMAFLFLFIAIITNILSNAATAVLFTPIAANLALKLGVDPRMLIYGVIFACNCSFITPIGYQTNLLVMSPGKYKFLDFMKGGIPLTIVMCLTYIILVSFYF